MITGEQFKLICRYLYGADWLRLMVHTTDINERTLRRWASGQNAVPDHMAERLKRELADKIAEGTGLLATLGKPEGQDSDGLA